MSLLSLSGVSEAEAKQLFLLANAIYWPPARPHRVAQTKNEGRRPAALVTNNREDGVRGRDGCDAEA